MASRRNWKKVQNRAARFVTGNYVFETGNMTGILGQLKWESLKKRRKDSRLILLYKGLKGKARIPTDDLIPKNLGRFGPGSFRPGSFRPILGVGRFGLGRWVVSANFEGGSIRPSGRFGQSI